MYTAMRSAVEAKNEGGRWRVYPFSTSSLLSKSEFGEYNEFADSLRG
jgi:hypothetical protein